jgi:hypothetical protein
MPTPDWVPAEHHARQVTALTDRCIASETALTELLRFIDPKILERNGFDWAAAVKEIMS